MNYDLVGIGNALVDIEVRVEDNFITQNAFTKGGMTLTSIEGQNKLLSQFDGAAHKICSGGSAANTVHGMRVLGANTYYLGRVADDRYGRHYTEDMQNCGVGFPGPDSADTGTGTCLILVTPDSERTMLTHLGISTGLHPENVDETIVKSAKAVYIEGYLWTGDDTRAAAIKMADIARKHRIPVAFTLSDAFVVNSFKEDLLDFIRWKTDILFCNDVEAKAMADLDDAEKAFDKLKHLAGTVFMTRGKDGSWVGKNGDDTLSVNAFPVKAVDTTGAGDLYAAGALYGLNQGLGLKESAIIGSYCASEVVTHFGARMPTHSHTDVDKILKAYKE
ncbi:adenosine kinase [Nitrospina watsonii]|uniref:Predicted ribokinase family sugar kinase n=1 Tax=Nitrospina watsonii TaxID=1323948 RepID=A0ABM9HB65_9BACT|nr:adenosine kinase [Nitrospina watsonii]CAI2717366.1 Predicted ribokinase family sugar kinase [Nitrospina watsonii]